MMVKKERSFAPLIHVSLEDLVPAEKSWVYSARMSIIGSPIVHEETFNDTHRLLIPIYLAEARVRT